MYEVLNHTVIGYSHLSKGIPCEDYSGCYADPDGRYYVVAVADGHGDPTCTRSDRGSRFAVLSAIEGMRELADFAMSREGFSGAGLEGLLDATPGGANMRKLGGRVVSLWYSRVRKDFESEPFTEDEIRGLGLNPESVIKNPVQLRHAYGTTLIACLVCDGLALFLHQGDGRCDVFYADGRVDQPIPWDDRCYDVYTTSLCDDDVRYGMRTWVIDLVRNPVAAVFMGSDGIEDSFADMEGTHCFYRKFAGTIVELGTGDQLGEFVDQYLAGLSRNGSADDMSVAGIVDIDAISPLLPGFDRQIEAYDKEMEARKIALSIRSKERKREVLRSKYEELTVGRHRRKKSLSKKIVDLQRQIAGYELEINRLDDTDPAVVERARQEYEEFEEEYQALLRRKELLEEEAGMLRTANHGTDALGSPVDELDGVAEEGIPRSGQEGCAMDVMHDTNSGVSPEAQADEGEVAPPPEGEEPHVEEADMGSSAASAGCPSGDSGNSQELVTGTAQEIPASYSVEQGPVETADHDGQDVGGGDRDVAAKHFAKPAEAADVTMEAREEPDGSPKGTSQGLDESSCEVSSSTIDGDAPEDDEARSAVDFDSVPLAGDGEVALHASEICDGDEGESTDYEQRIAE